MLRGQPDNGRESAFHVGLESPQCGGKVAAARAITRESADTGTGGPGTICGTRLVPAKRKRLPGGVEGRAREAGRTAVQQICSPFFSDTGTWRREGQIETAVKLLGRGTKNLHVIIDKNDHKKTECLTGVTQH